MALGEIATGVFSNSDALAREVLASNFADFANVGARSDCATTAACFLSRAAA